MRSPIILTGSSFHAVSALQPQCFIQSEARGMGSYIVPATQISENTVRCAVSPDMYVAATSRMSLIFGRESGASMRAPAHEDESTGNDVYTPARNVGLFDARAAAAQDGNAIA